MVSAEQYRTALRRHPAGVAIVTMTSAGGPVGFTATSFASLSLNPPLVSFNITHTSSSIEAMRAARSVVIHLPGAGQLELAQRFRDRPSSDSPTDPCGICCRPANPCSMGCRRGCGYAWTASSPLAIPRWSSARSPRFIARIPGAPGAVAVSRRRLPVHSTADLTAGAGQLRCSAGPRRWLGRG